MAFQQGLSGLNAASKALDVISNNVANANTVGFKAGRAEFGDLYAAALSGAAGGTQIGIGAGVSAVTQLFTQGNITTTNNPLDLAINGNGFFRLVGPDGGSTAFTRNGQFNVDKNGNIVNAQGFFLTGYPVQNNAITTGILQPIRIDTDQGGGDPRITSEVSAILNLDSRLGPIDPAAIESVGTGTPPVELVPSMYNSATSATIYDSLGNPHTLTLYFVKLDTPAGQWNIYPSIDGEMIDPITPMVDRNGDPFQFNTSGRLEGLDDPTLDAATRANIGKFDLDDLDFSAFGALDAQNVVLDFSQATQFGTSFGVTSLTQNGFAPGQLTGVTVSDDGIVQGRFSNGESRDLGQIVLVNFRNPNGLLSLGGNMWAESPASGQPTPGEPGSSNLGLLSAGSVEEANLDLTNELVALIVQQRAYQANAQSVRAQDQILQTIVNLR